MVTAVPSYRLPLTALFLVGVLVAGFFLFWRTASPLSAWSGIDLDFLFPPIALWTVLTLLSRLAARADGTRLAALLWRPTRSGHELRAAAALAFARRFLADLAWFILGLGLIAAVPAMTEALAERESGPVPDAALPYVAAFGPMSMWGLPLMTLVAVLRAIAQVRPGVGAALSMPWWRLVTLGAGYVLLSNGGVLNVAVGFEGSPLLTALAAALALSYGALALRNVLRERVRQQTANVLRALLLLAEAAWVSVSLQALAGLPSAIESVLASHFGFDAARAAEYVVSLGELTSPKLLAVLLPFALVRAWGVFWPPVDRILGFPVVRLALLSVVYVVFSGSGILAVAVQLSVPQVMAVLALGLILSYAASIVGNVARTDSQFRYWPAASVVLALAAASIAALAAGLSMGVVLDHLPAINAALIDNESTRSIGREAIPYFATLFDVRVSAAALGAAMAFALTLPWSREDRVFTRWQPLLNAVACSAAGYLVWVVGSSLSPLGHGFVLGGAAGAAGMFALGLAQVFSYAAASQNALAPMASWLAVSRLRGVVLGAALAVYGLLLRPVLYEALWFAALYEYIALLAVLFLALLFVVDLLRRDTAVPEAQEPDPGQWTRHHQVLESKDDPRSALSSAMRRRFVDYGEWKPLWSYLMALLYRNGVSLEEMRAALRPIRASAVSSAAMRFLDRSNLRRMGRVAALEETLRRADSALASGQPPPPSIKEADLRAAAAPFVETGADAERLVIALIVGHCGEGLDVQSAIDRWLHLLDIPERESGWFLLPWTRANARTRERGERVRLVDNTAATLFNPAARASANLDPRRLAEVVAASGAGD